MKSSIVLFLHCRESFRNPNLSFYQPIYSIYQRYYFIHLSFGRYSEQCLSEAHALTILTTSLNSSMIITSSKFEILQQSSSQRLSYPSLQSSSNVISICPPCRWSGATFKFVTTNASSGSISCSRTRISFPI